MIPYRIWGDEPRSVVVIHGGPGAPGEMGPVARELSAIRGVFEPFQTATSVPGQVGELAAHLQEQTTLPVILIGFSWGAMLSLLFAAQYPTTVKKLVLIDSGPLDPAFADKILETRLNRLPHEKRTEVLALMKGLNDPSILPDASLLARFGELISQADSVDPIPDEPSDLNLRLMITVHRQVWEEAAALRASGYFVEKIRSITCPVVVIHGASDPHPVQGVVEPFTKAGVDLSIHILPACGHTPWKERQARDQFFDLLKREIEEPGRR
jgi:pimeloyl-ACP methyl ester carboxylesterase